MTSILPSVKELEHSEACYCGKCIKKRQNKSNFTVFPYSKDIESSYNLHYKEKHPDLSLPKVVIKSSMSSLDRGYREFLPLSLVSSQKYDYRPYKIEPKETKIEKKI